MDDYLKSVLEGHAFLLFDGAMGTMLQKRGLEPGELPDMLCLTRPDDIAGIHREYVEAGSQVVTTNTLGANARKLAEAGSTASVAEVFSAAVSCARSSGARYVAADIGPIGELMFPMGELEFSEAYELFAEQARAAQDAGADLVIIETMADLVEMAAAVLAAKDSCSLPLIATMTFTASGRTFLGTAPREAALVLALLGVDVLGVNCSAGPIDLQPVVLDMLAVAPCPVIVQANAGLPEVVDGETVYSLAPAEYAQGVLPMIEAGAVVVGGCCGTDPAYLHELAMLLDGREPAAQPISRAELETLARSAADEGGRDGELIEMILDAPDRAELRDALADEYDE